MARTTITIPLSASPQGKRKETTGGAKAGSGGKSGQVRGKVRFPFCFIRIFFVACAASM